MDNPRDFGGGVRVRIARHVSLAASERALDGDRLDEALSGDGAKREDAPVNDLGSLGGRAQGHRREAEDRGLLGERAGVGDDAEGVLLKRYVVVEAERPVRPHERVKLGAALLDAPARPRVHAVEHGHPVLLCQRVHGVDHAREVGLVVDVLLAVRRQQDVAPRLQALAREHVGSLDTPPVGLQHLAHGRAHHERARRVAAHGGEVAARVLGVAEVHVAHRVHDAAVDLLGEVLVEAAVACLHVEDRDLEALSRYSAQAGVGVAEDQQGVWPDLSHELVALLEHVPHGLAEVGAGDPEVAVGLAKPQPLEEHLVELVVVVLPGVDEHVVEDLVAELDGLGQLDDLRPRPHDRHEPELLHRLPYLIVGVQPGVRANPVSHLRDLLCIALRAEGAAEVGAHEGLVEPDGAVGHDLDPPAAQPAVEQAEQLELADARGRHHVDQTGGALQGGALHRLRELQRGEAGPDGAGVAAHGPLLRHEPVEEPDARRVGVRAHDGAPEREVPAVAKLAGGLGAVVDRPAVGRGALRVGTGVPGEDAVRAHVEDARARALGDAREHVGQLAVKVGGALRVALREVVKNADAVDDDVEATPFDRAAQQALVARVAEHLLPEERHAAAREADDVVAALAQVDGYGVPRHARGAKYEEAHATAPPLPRGPRARAARTLRS